MPIQAALALQICGDFIDKKPKKYCNPADDTVGGVLYGNELLRKAQRRLALGAEKLFPQLYGGNFRRGNAWENDCKGKNSHKNTKGLRHCNAASGSVRNGWRPVNRIPPIYVVIVEKNAHTRVHARTRTKA